MNTSRYLEVSPYNSDQGCLIGRLPKELTKEELADLTKITSTIKLVRSKCLDCCGGVESEVRKCTSVTCPLWLLRMGKNPFNTRNRFNSKDYSEEEQDK